MNKIIIFGFLIFVFFFYKLGNTIFRIDSTGEKVFCLSSLIEGFIGPVRTLLLIISQKEFYLVFEFLKFEFFRLSNPYSALFFSYYLYKIIQNNFN